MKQFKARLLALCGLMVLVAAALAPMAAQAQAYGPPCPDVRVPCSQTRVNICQGQRQGTSCVYSYLCLTCQI